VPAILDCVERPFLRPIHMQVTPLPNSSAVPFTPNAFSFYGSVGGQGPGARENLDHKVASGQGQGKTQRGQGKSVLGEREGGQEPGARV
jgi:hypothetical protein